MSIIFDAKGPQTSGGTEEVNFNAHTEGSALPAEFNEPPVTHPVPAVGEKFDQRDHLVNRIAIPTLAALLNEVLGTVDASIPNKDQNKAVKHIMRKAFDRAYMEIVTNAWPENNYGFTGDYYILQPTSQADFAELKKKLRP